MKFLLLILLFVASLSPSLAQTNGSHWYDHAVIYEIYPRSFQDSNGDGIGDLKGVTQRLDYLKDLGVDAIWLTPFFPSPNKDFGYDISNYTDVAPEYGTLADWDELVREASKRNIHVLVDFVLNHSSDQNAWFQESRSSRDNPKRNWYVWRDGGKDGGPPTHWPSIFGGYTWTLDPTTNQWYYHIFLPQQPDVNWASPGLRKAMFDVARFWLDRGASGFRLDATPYLFEDPAFPDDPKPKSGPSAGQKPYNSARPENHEVLRQLRAILDSYHGEPGQEKVLLGESVTSSIEGLRDVYGAHRDEIELPMDFLFGDLKTLDAREFKRQVDMAETLLDNQTPVFFLSSHDHQRQYSVFGDGQDNDQIARLTAALTLLQRGTILMYYGEEIGMAQMPKSELASFPVGPKRPVADVRDGCRTPMQWTAGPGAGFTAGGAPWLPIEPAAKTYNVAAEKASPDSLYAWYAQLLKLRHENPAFRDGAYVPLDSGSKSVFAFARKSASGAGAVVVLNMSDKPQKITIKGLPTGAKFAQVLLSSPAVAKLLTPTLSLEPHGVVIVAY